MTFMSFVGEIINKWKWKLAFALPIVKMHFNNGYEVKVSLSQTETSSATSYSNILTCKKNASS